MLPKYTHMLEYPNDCNKVIKQLFLCQVGLRDYQDCKADVILKYSADEARNLKSYGEFPDTVKINETVTFGEEGFDDDIEFDDVDSRYLATDHS